MGKKKQDAHEDELPLIRWIKVAGPLAEDIGYGGPAVYAPAAVPVGEEEGYLSSLDLLRGLVLCWRQAPPDGKPGLTPELRRRMFDKLAEACGGLSPREAVRKVCEPLLKDPATLEAGMRGAVNGLHICGDDPDYRTTFILLAAGRGRLLKPPAARDAALHILSAIKGLELSELIWLDRETILAACTAALAGLDDRAGLAEFNKERIENYKFASTALAEAVSDLAVKPGIDLAGAFARLHAAMQKASSLEPGAAPPEKKRKPDTGTANG